MRQDGILSEVRRNTLGVLEIALLMPIARTRFGDTKEEALRSFVVPVLLFPLTLMLVYMHPSTADQSADAIPLLHSLRTVALSVIFLATVYWIVREVDRKKHFYQFVVASNWLSLPAAVIFIPVIWMIGTGTYTWQELAPFMTCLTLYIYAQTAFMAAHVLRIPWELAGFIVFVNMCISNGTLDLIYWIGEKI